jgi:hypothetical protein
MKSGPGNSSPRTSRIRKPWCRARG